jgi:hypothetical protein
MRINGLILGLRRLLSRVVVPNSLRADWGGTAGGHPLNSAYLLGRRSWRNGMYLRGVVMFIPPCWMILSRSQCHDQRESPGLGPTLGSEVISGSTLHSLYQVLLANDQLQV